MIISNSYFRIAISFILLLSIESQGKDPTAPTIEEGKCFKGYMTGGDGWKTFFPGCLLVMVPGTRDGNFNEVVSNVYSRRASLSGDVKLKVSKKAQVLFYDENCGPSNIICTALGKLSRMHPSGYYSYRLCKSKSCKSLSKNILSKISDCQDDGDGVFSNQLKVKCNNLIKGFLASANCKAGSSKCLTFVSSQMSQPFCDLDTGTYDQLKCTGPAGGAISVAGAGDAGKGDGDRTGGPKDDPKADPDDDDTPDDDTNPDPNNNTNTGGTVKNDPDNDPGDDTDISPQDIAALGGLANQLGSQVFRPQRLDSSFQTNSNGNGGNAASVNAVSPPSENGTGVRLGGSVRPTTIASKLPPQLPNRPAKRKAQGGGPQGGGPAAGGARGGLGGGGALGAGGGSGGRGGGKKRRRRRRGSPLKVKKGQRFYGATGLQAAKGKDPGTALSRKIRKKIKENNASGLTSNAAVNQAFQSGLQNQGSRGTSGTLVIPATFFPVQEVQDEFEAFRQRREYLQENGQWF